MQIKLYMLIVISEVEDIYVHYICKECKGNTGIPL
jgi:DNA polymerase III alpha subunit (gram-positive type)